MTKPKSCSFSPMAVHRIVNIVYIFKRLTLRFYIIIALTMLFDCMLLIWRRIYIFRFSRLHHKSFFVCIYVFESSVGYKRRGVNGKKCVQLVVSTNRMPTPPQYSRQQKPYQQLTNLIDTSHFLTVKLCVILDLIGNTHIHIYVFGALNVTFYNFQVLSTTGIYIS